MLTIDSVFILRKVLTIMLISFLIRNMNSTTVRGRSTLHIARIAQTTVNVS